MRYTRDIFWALLLLCMILSVLPAGVLGEPLVIKFATIAPEGTPWMSLMEEMNDELRHRSHDQVAFRFYPGGVAGDERDVLRKIRINQLHGGAFSGFGLGEIVPEIRVL
jgi:TRAP-type C4-dicarboxylate transport system substrate-binding protein